LPADTISLIDALKISARRDEAWLRFMARYHDTVHAWCRRRGLDDVDADDLALQVFEKMLRDLPRGKYDPERGRFRSYLAAVVRSVVSHFFERMANRPGDRGAGGSSNARDLQQVIDPAAEELSESLEVSLHADVMRAFERVLARIAPENRDAVKRVLLHGERAVEVARDLGKSPTSVFQLVARTRASVREEYGNLIGGGGVE